MPNLERAPASVSARLRAGLVIPAHPLALNRRRKLDERAQCALTRYYHDAGAGGIAVGVHTTQFAVREHGLLRPVLELAAGTIQRADKASGGRTVRIAGIGGLSRQAVKEARLACELGYDAGLLCFGALARQPDQALLDHARMVAQEIPLFGFYLQPAVGGRVLSLGFWRRFLEIESVVAVKIAPFNRYQTIDVIRALSESGRAAEVALYTGNDDHILLDLLSEYQIGPSSPRIHFAGGLLGQWACWTQRAVEHLAQCQRARRNGRIPRQLMIAAHQLTEANGAIFDAARRFAGCIPGLHEVLRRQGLLETTACLDPREKLSPGQAEEIDRVIRLYPDLQDTEFVRANRERWMAG